jgi:hypothetical protein
MAKVYVSSTIADLRRERELVFQWLREARHQAVDSYLPDSDTVRDSCLNDVDTCDLYVLILGHRYGTQPAQDNPEGLSITHLEYRRAGQSGIPRVALLRTSIPDISLSDIDDPDKAPLVRAFRAEVGREVRPAEFRDEGGLMRGLSTGVQSELEKLGERPGGVGAAAPWAADPVLRLAPRPTVLAGREDLLAELDNRLGGGDRSGPRVVTLLGLAGAGKTSVALEFAHRHVAEARVAWQFAAQDPAVLSAGFGELAAALGVREGTGASDPVVPVHGALAAAPAGWLLVFDNAPDPEAMQAFLPPAGAGRVLITSRNALWPPGQAVDVPVLDTEVAAGFLVDRTGDHDRQSAVGLAEATGGLPLALEQAAAYIRASGGSLAGYLASFHRRRAGLLARGQPAGYQGTVATTWSLAFTQLEQSAPAAAGLLRLLAFCAPEPVPLRLLLQPRPGLADNLRGDVAAVLVSLLEDELAVDDAVVDLRKFSLVTPAGVGLVTVHRLVQAVTVDQMPQELAGAWRQAAAMVIDAAIPSDPEQPEIWSDFAALLPHAQAALGADTGGLERIARYLGFSGSHVAARDLQQRIVGARESVLGPEHPDTLTARDYLARWTGAAGDWVAARDQYAALLPVAERVLGVEDLEALQIRGNLAYWTGQAGDPAASRDLFAALVPIAERLLGQDHPETLMARAFLARWTGEAGDAAAARDQFAALLPVRERVSGLNHQYTLHVRAHLASWTGQAGDAAAARDQFAALLPVREQVSGLEHPETLQVRNQLARWTGEAGDPADARDQYVALLPVRERVSGPQHPDTLRDRGNLAHWTGQAGDAVAARDQFTALLPIAERAGGPEHPEVLHVRAHLASWTGQAGDAVAARDQFTALLPIAERVLGPEHPDTLHVRHELALWTGQAGDPAAARDQFAALLPIAERVLGPEHPDTLRARGNLAHWTGQAGDAVAARDQFTTLLPIAERVGGPEHPEVLTARAYLARWTGEAGDAAAARNLFASLLPIRERVSGREHPDTLHASRSLAYWTKQADAAS